MEGSWISNILLAMQVTNKVFHTGPLFRRVMANSTLFTQLVGYAKVMDKERINWYMGGNAPLMAVRFFMEGAQVLLGAHMSRK